MIIGIDPGWRTGAVAIVGDNFAEVHDLPTFEKGGVNAHALADLLNEEGATAIYIEQLAGIPRQSSSATFKTGDGYGAIKATAALSNIPVFFVSPAKWKQTMRVPKDKDEARRIAIERFPKLEPMLRRKKDEHRAEALLIALYGAKQ